MREHDRYEIRHRVQMPDGKSIEVLYAPLPAAATAAGAARQASASHSTPHRPTPQHRSDPPHRPSTPHVSSLPRVPGTPHGPSPGEEAAAEAPALHVCVGCGGERVHPLDWCEHSLERWAIVLRCPDCEQTREGVFGRGMVERLDDELDRASAALLSDYRRLVHANMSEEIERFARALQLDLIGPADFSPTQR